ncbi:MAG TPA: hypothetical protein DDY98_05050 [Ruminococcaceae bacterium]|nr:hypothetical protein [Oscillospiraceae bacterium]
MESIDTYIKNRKHPENTTYKTEKLRDILSVTRGCLIYQEQVMQVFRELAGYSYGRADVVRRAMSKKKHAVMEQERKTFIAGAQERGIEASVANSIFDDMSSFASYAFNKSHAAAYSLVAYRTAYLKCHHPCEFMAALLTSVLDQTAKVCGYIGECERLKIKVEKPNVNNSFAGFRAKDGKILFGLLAIKNLGRTLIKTIVEEREENGEYTSFYSFCKRIYGNGFNRRAVESLIFAGALDCFSLNRRQMLMMLPSIIEELDAQRSSQLGGQMNFFNLLGEEEQQGPEVPNVDDLPQEERLLREKEVVGFYVSGHPMAQYAELAEKTGCTKLFDLSDGNSYSDNDKVKILGIITSVKKKMTKKNEEMAFLTVEDMTGSTEVLLFPRTVAENRALIQPSNIVSISGRLSLREDRDPSVVCEQLSPCPSGAEEVTAQPKKKTVHGLFLRVESEHCGEKKRADNLLSIFEGRTPVRYYYCDTQKYSAGNTATEINEPLIQELKRILGEKNVVIQ